MHAVGHIGCQHCVLDRSTILLVSGLRFWQKLSAGIKSCSNGVILAVKDLPVWGQHVVTRGRIAILGFRFRNEGHLSIA